MINRIFNFFKPKDSKDKPNIEQGEINHKPLQESVILDNAFEVKQNIIDSIVDVLKPLKYSDNSIKTLTLYVFNSDNPLAISNILGESNFETELRLSFDNAQLNQLQGCVWSFRNEKPPSDATAIAKGLYLHAAYVNTNIIAKARIKAIQGELQELSYIIDSANSNNFNIGRGANPRLENGVMHKNYIVVKDKEDFIDTDDENIHFNRYVSRAHACIAFSNTSGFMLKVYDGGCYKTGNRTRIFRENSQPIDVQNTQIVYPLQHNDQIELGKSVILHFELIFE